MSIFETFSKRKKKFALAGKSVELIYDTLPATFRNQVIHLIAKMFGKYVVLGPYDFNSTIPMANSLWEDIFKTICEEKGVFGLGDGGKDISEQICSYIQTGKTEEVLDIIEYSFIVANSYLSKYPADWLSSQENIMIHPNEAIRDLNYRFREHTLGYQFIDNQLIEENSQYTHGEIVEPAINLLYQNGFVGANSEYLKAHEHYRKGRYSEAIVDANKAFESTMKIICEKRSWPYASTDTAKALLKVLFEHDLIPKELRSQFDHLQGVMESGAPTIRNKPGRAHGSGSTIIDVPDYLAAYVLHLVAANILLLVNAHLNK